MKSENHLPSTCSEGTGSADVKIVPRVTKNSRKKRPLGTSTYPKKKGGNRKTKHTSANQTPLPHNHMKTPTSAPALSFFQKLKKLNRKSHLESSGGP